MGELSHTPTSQADFSLVATDVNLETNRPGERYRYRGYKEIKPVPTLEKSRDSAVYLSRL